MSIKIARILFGAGLVVAGLSSPVRAENDGPARVPNFYVDPSYQQGAGDEICLVNHGATLTLEAGSTTTTMEMVLPLPAGAPFDFDHFWVKGDESWSFRVVDREPESGTVHVAIEPLADVEVKANSLVTCVQVGGLDVRTLPVVGFRSIVPARRASN